MQFFKSVKRFFSGEEETGDGQPSRHSDTSTAPTASGRGGFVAQQQIPVPRQPILQNAGYGAAGGVQGLDWYKAGLKVDADGDLADQFFQEPRDVSRKRPPDKGFKVQKRNVKGAALESAELAVEKGEVVVIPPEEK